MRDRDLGGPAYLGIDVGTSGAKLALVTLDGWSATAEAPYKIQSPAPGWAESDPAEWIAAVESAILQLSDSADLSSVRGIGVTGQMHGAVLCDAAGAALRPAILWLDRRADGELSRWRRLPADSRTRLANPIVSGMTGPALAWLAAHEPAAVEQAVAVLHAKDVVRTALLRGVANDPVTDRSDASATLMWDVPSDGWATDVCRALGLPLRLLPDVRTSADIVGHSGILAHLVAGAPATVAVVAGAADTPAAMVAVGGRGLQINLGTGAQLLLPRARPDRTGMHPSIHLYADAGDSWYAMAALRNGASALDAAARALDLSWPDLIAAAAVGRPGLLSYLPFVTGERGGVTGPDSEAGWHGVTADATRPDLARAAVEGLMFALRRAGELLGPCAVADDPIALTGGGWRSNLLLQLAADVLGRPVRRIAVRSASATGAAVLAARGIDGETPACPTPGPTIDPAATPGLDEAYRRWRARAAGSDR